MSKNDKDQLFHTAYAQLKLALAFADGIKDSPSASADAAFRVNTAVSKANAMMQSFENAMKDVTSTPTAQLLQK